MEFKDRTYQFFLILSLLFIADILAQQQWEAVPPDSNYKNITVTWCTINPQEQAKCKNLSMALQRDIVKVGFTIFSLDCLQASNKEECMVWIDEEKATLTTLDAGEVFEAGRYHSLVPIAQEASHTGIHNNYAVAVLKKNSLPEVTSIADLRNKKACFAGVGTLSGWIVPVHTLMKRGGMEVVDCNNHVKSVTEFFSTSCAVKALSDKYNPLGDNSDKLCSLCIGKVPGGRCTESDPYAGYEGALRCLIEAGDVAFVKHSTVTQIASEFVGLNKDSFELLCPDGSRQRVESYRMCNWGIVPADAVVTTSASSFDDRRNYQRLLLKIADMIPAKTNTHQTDNPTLIRQNNQHNQFIQNWPHSKRQTVDNVLRKYQNDSQDRYINPDTIDSNDFGINIDPYASPLLPEIDYNRFNGIENNENSSNKVYEVFQLSVSPEHKNLLFQDTTKSFIFLSENKQSYTGFLENALDLILGIRNCPVEHMTLCVTSEAELEKCIKMRTALKAQLIKPEMRCEKGHSQINCMEDIRSGVADVTVLDASDVYTAGLTYELIPFMSEVYNLGEPYYYAVAVGKEADPETELTYLKGKYTCHGGINMAAGWVYPLAFLVSNGWIRPYGCNSIRAAAEYFTKSCVPGALSTEYNTGVPYDNLCDLCHGSSFRYCRRDASDDYYGHTGAFRCLVEGGGHVAFVKHTTVLENTNGKRREWWARDALVDDFELLCPDGTRAEIQNYATCNLGTVKANAIVTRGGYGYNETQINAYINLFSYAQTFYGRKNADEFSFSMFSSVPPFSDLIFQDATQQLMVIPPDQRFYSTYLGENYMKARRIVDCYAAGVSVQSSLFATLICAFIALLICN